MQTQSKTSFKLKRAVQKKAFTTWANSILEKNGSSSEIDDLFKNLRNGKLLGKLIENLSDEKLRLGPGKSRQQSVDNVEICLDSLEESGVSTRGIDSEDVVDGCPDTTLELMWAIITGLYIDKKELLKKGENKTVERALLLWAQDKTQGYRDVRVKDFTCSSWKDGLAFLALIDASRPNLIRFKDFHNDERRHNLKTAFDEAEDELDIPSLLDVEDMMKSQVDERSMAAYVACFYKGFADKRRRRSRSESRSDYSDTSSSAGTSRSDGNRTERERRSRSTSRNKHKPRESSRSRSSDSSSSGSHISRSRRGLKKKKERSHSSSSTASSSYERRNTRRGSKNRKGCFRRRSSSNTDNGPDTRNGRKELRNRSEEDRRKKLSSEGNKGHVPKRSNSHDRQRSTVRSLSRTRNRRDRRSHSRERQPSLDLSLSRTKRDRNRQGLSYSNNPDQRGVENKGSWGRYERSPGSSRNKERFPGLSRNEDGYKDIHVREIRDHSRSSSSQEDEYTQTGAAQFYTRSKKHREKYLNYLSPKRPDSWSRIGKKIPNPRQPALSRNYPSQGEDMNSVINKFLLLGQMYSPETVLLTVPSNPSPVQFEWQFQDEHGAWITYGKPNSAGNGSNATSTTSDDIENYFVANPNSPPVIVQAKHNRYILDFQGKTQKNIKTNVNRVIRRIRKQSVNITPLNAHPSLQTVPMNPASVTFEWQFQDEHGSWITYGKPNSAGNASHITTTSSDDVERHYASNPANPTPLTIRSKGNVPYVLDFKAMMQTNTKTSVQRKIRRVPKASLSNTTAPKGSTFVWVFKDDHGNWIKYGETSSSNDATSATTTTSDDIETKYARNPTASLEIASGHHKYIIDFNAMTQTNINTKAVRAIRRQLVTPSDLPSNWTPMTASDKGLRVVALSSSDTEYNNQVAFVKKTLPSNFTITKVFRIQNEHLWMDFVSRKNRLKKRNPHIKYKEVYLFHGTNPQHVQSICAENLDFRLNGTNGTVYGKGTYFATSAAYSANYAGSGPIKLMFIVKVLIGHYTVGNTSLRRPPRDASGVFYDATVDNQANPTIYVKYDNTEYYPEYYIEFT